MMIVTTMITMMMMMMTFKWVICIPHHVLVWEHRKWQWRTKPLGGRFKCSNVTNKLYVTSSLQRHKFRFGAQRQDEGALRTLQVLVQRLYSRRWKPGNRFPRYSGLEWPRIPQLDPGGERIRAHRRKLRRHHPAEKSSGHPRRHPFPTRFQVVRPVRGHQLQPSGDRGTEGASVQFTPR